MNKLVAPVAVLVLTAGLAMGQQRSRVYTTPQAPSADALNRLNLKLAWRTYLPTDDLRDGLATIQLVGERLYVQMRNGTVAALNAETGQQLWLAQVGRPYRVAQPLGFNYDSVFGVNGSRLFALDRATGRLKWESDLAQVPSAAPVADSMQVYVCLNSNRMAVYRLPNIEPDTAPRTPAPGYAPLPIPGEKKAKGKTKEAEEAKPAPSEGSRVSGMGGTYGTASWASSPLTSKPPPLTYSPLATATETNQELFKRFLLEMIWEHSPLERLDFEPLLTLRNDDGAGFLMLATSRGNIFGTNKYRKATAYRFQTDAPVTAPLAQYGDIAYLVAEDATLNAINLMNGQSQWRLPVGGATRRRPAVTDEDVYVTPDRAGLYRVNRATGEVVWNNRQAERFLSANRKFVYALDATNQLLVLDRARGTELSRYDARRFTMPIANDYTDRIYLAADNGLLVCLYDRDYTSPAWNKQYLEEKKLEPKKKEMKEKPGPAENK